MTTPKADRTLLERRQSLGLTQATLATLMRTPLVTYKGWESGRFKPPHVVWAYMDLLERDRATLASRRYRKVTKYDHAEMVRRYASGESTYAIANALGCSAPTVRSALNARGVYLRAPNKAKTDNRRAAALREEGLTFSQIAASLGVSLATATLAVRRGQVLSEGATSGARDD